jgi:hypothetical protein
VVGNGIASPHHEPEDFEPAVPESDAKPAPREPETPKPPEPRTSVGEETMEYDIEHALANEASQKEDVLEETPEFLQDTPDHDRLWFEQRPPRDFDFDG